MCTLLLRTNVHKITIPINLCRYQLGKTLSLISEPQHCQLQFTQSNKHHWQIASQSLLNTLQNSRHITHDRYAYSFACAVSVEGLFRLPVKPGSSWMALAQKGTSRNLRTVNDHTRRLSSNHGDHCRLTATSSPAVYTTTNHQFHTSNGFVDPEKRTLNG